MGTKLLVRKTTRITSYNVCYAKLLRLLPASDRFLGTCKIGQVVDLAPFEALDRTNADQAGARQFVDGDLLVGRVREAGRFGARRARLGEVDRLHAAPARRLVGAPGRGDGADRDRAGSYNFV